MARLTILAVSSVLALSTVPAHAQPVGPVVPEVAPPLVYHHPDWRAHERERAYRHEEHRLKAERRDLEAHRKALHEQRKLDEENGFYGR
jgi:hypothetical protein